MAIGNERLISRMGIVPAGEPRHRHVVLPPAVARPFSPRAPPRPTDHHGGRNDHHRRGLGTTREGRRNGTDARGRRKRTDLTRRWAREIGPRASGLPRPQEPTTFKLFVGNLPFSTTADDLKEHFGSVGNVLSAVVVMRGHRSMGYAFLEFATQAEVEAAAAKFHKTDLGGRSINVEAAAPRAPGERRPRRPRRSRSQNGDGDNAEGGERPPRPRRRGPKPAPAGGEAGGEAAPTEGGSGEDDGFKQRPRRRNNRRRAAGEGEGATSEGGEATGEQQAPRRAGVAARRRRADDEDDQQGQQAQATEEGGERPRRPRARRPRRPRAEGAEGAEGEQQTAGPRRRRQPRPKREGAENEPLSQTMLFVASLAYSVDDDALAKAFEGINIKSAHVVRDYAGRSKGFAFVECADAAAQQLALQTMDQKVINDRAITVKPGRISSERPAQASTEGESAAPETSAQ